MMIVIIIITDCVVCHYYSSERFYYHFPFLCFSSSSPLSLVFVNLSEDIALWQCRPGSLRSAFRFVSRPLSVRGEWLELFVVWRERNTHRNFSGRIGDAGNPQSTSCFQFIYYLLLAYYFLTNHPIPNINTHICGHHSVLWIFLNGFAHSTSH